MDILTLLWLPPLAGMGIDLLIAKWADGQYKPAIRKIGKIVLLIALYFILLTVVRYYVLKS